MSRPDWRLSRGVARGHQERGALHHEGGAASRPCGWKRFRPLLVTLSAQFGDPYAPGVVPSAGRVELTHLATLYHDDVMDEADVRRGVDSANSRWGNSVAVLTGDFLFARASHILADLGLRRSVSRRRPSSVWSPVRSWRRPAPGTAATRWSTTSTSWRQDGLTCGGGLPVRAMMSGADETVVDVLTQYGERLGVAFQLADDVLDNRLRLARVREDARDGPAGRRPHPSGPAPA